MRKSSAIFVSAIALGLAMFVPLKASAQGVNLHQSRLPGLRCRLPGLRLLSALSPLLWVRLSELRLRLSKLWSHLSELWLWRRYGYGRPYYGTYWGHNRRVARRVNRRWDRWD